MIKFFTGWDVRFRRDTSQLPKPTNKKSVPKLVYGFFKYYSGDIHTKNVLCPLTGELIFKNRMEQLDLPPPFRSYKLNLLRKAIDEKFPITHGLCLQDPFQLNRNITYQLQDGLFHKFKLMCRETVKLARPWAESKRFVNEGRDRRLS